jgi:hypothetical protein
MVPPERGHSWAQQLSSVFWFHHAWYLIGTMEDGAEKIFGTPWKSRTAANKILARLGAVYRG